MLNFEDFKAEVGNRILNYLDESYKDAKVSIIPVLKNNDVTLDGLTIRKDGKKASPVIYLEAFYADYLQNGDIEVVLKSIATTQMENEVDCPVDFDSVMKFENVRDNILPKLIGAKENQNLLVDRPHKYVDGLAVTYYILLEANIKGTAYVQITDDLLSRYNLNKEELHQLAISNMKKKQKAVFASLSEFIKGTTDTDEVSQDMMYILKNSNDEFGASVILNNELMDEVAEKVGDKFFIIPSSIHELIVVPRSTRLCLEQLESTIRKVNSLELKPEEVLSNYVYTYDAANHLLYKAKNEVSYA